MINKLSAAPLITTIREALESGFDGKHSTQGLTSFFAPMESHLCKEA